MSLWDVIAKSVCLGMLSGQVVIKAKIWNCVTKPKLLYQPSNKVKNKYLMSDIVICMV